MEAMSANVDWNAIADAFETLDRALGGFDLNFSPKNAEKMVSLLDVLLERTAEQDAPAGLHALLDAVSNWIAAFEKATLDFGPPLDPVDLLRHLMDANGLRQRDIADILGGQSIVSAILNGRRQINARQAVALAHRFSLSPAAFLPLGEAAQSAQPVISGIEFTAEGVDRLTLDDVVIGMPASGSGILWQVLDSPAGSWLQ